MAAVEAKKALRGSGLPALTNVGEKGGPAVAAAACQALLALAGQAAAMESEQRGPSRGGRAGQCSPATADILNPGSFAESVR